MVGGSTERDFFPAPQNSGSASSSYSVARPWPRTGPAGPEMARQQRKATCLNGRGRQVLLAQGQSLGQGETSEGSNAVKTDLDHLATFWINL